MTWVICKEVPYEYGRTKALTQLNRLVIDHDEKSLLAFNFFNFLFPAGMFYMFTILFKKSNLQLEK